MTAEHSRQGLWDELRGVYHTYDANSYGKPIPKEPWSDRMRGEGEQFARVLFGMPTVAVMMFRLRNWLVAHDVPLLPYVCELISTGTWRVTIGRRVEIGPGLVIPHGHVVIDGVVKIGSDCVINPWVTIGLSGSRRWGFDQRGPIIGDRVHIGTGSKVLGPITIGDDVRIGANAVVIDDVPSGATVVGAPARIVRDKPPEWPR